MASKVVTTGDPKVDKAIQAVHEAIPDLRVFDGAREVTDVTLVSGVTKRIVHGLHRKYRGFILTGLSAVATIIDDRSKSDIDTYLYLLANANTTIRLVVF